jgi:hypothetical protein
MGVCDNYFYYYRGMQSKNFGQHFFRVDLHIYIVYEREV